MIIDYVHVKYLDITGIVLEEDMPKDYYEEWEFFSSLKKLKKYVQKEIYADAEMYSYKFDYSKSEKAEFETFFDWLGEGHKDILTYAWGIIELDTALKRRNIR